ncbi:hypothetical protein D3C76_1346090 [compost metagenome]
MHLEHALAVLRVELLLYAVLQAVFPVADGSFLAGLGIELLFFAVALTRFELAAGDQGAGVVRAAHFAVRQTLLEIGCTGADIEQPQYRDWVVEYPSSKRIFGVDLVQQTLYFMGLTGIDLFAEASGEVEAGQGDRTQCEAAAGVGRHQNLLIHGPAPAGLESVKNAQCRQMSAVIPI